jgi:hypothetical protein
MMNKTRLNFLLVLILVLISTISVYSQDEEVKIWTSIDLKKQVNKWDFTSEIELREAFFFEQMERLSLQLEALYDITDFLSAGASYMVMNFYDQKFDDYQLRHRFQAIANAKVKAGRFEFSLREKGEITFKDESDRIEDDGDIDTYRLNPESLWRNRLKIEYDIKNAPLTPAIALESFYFLNDPDGNQFEKLRYTLSIAYRINKQNRITLFTHYNKELLEDETDSYVAGLGYTYRF